MPKTNIFICLFIAVFVAGCSKDNNATNPQYKTFNFSPLKASDILVYASGDKKTTFTYEILSIKNNIYEIEYTVEPDYYNMSQTLIINRTELYSLGGVLLGKLDDNSDDVTINYNYSATVPVGTFNCLFLSRSTSQLNHHQLYYYCNQYGFLVEYTSFTVNQVGSSYRKTLISKNF